MPNTEPLPLGYGYPAGTAATLTHYAPAPPPAAVTAVPDEADVDAACDDENDADVYDENDAAVDAALDEIGPPDNVGFQNLLPNLRLAYSASPELTPHDSEEENDDDTPTLAYPKGKARTKAGLALEAAYPPRFVHHADMTAEDLQYVAEELVRIRRPERDYPTDHNVWVADNHVTGTELSLRLALYLLDKRLVSSDIHIALTGYELTRQCAPRFPVASYLADRGYAPRHQARIDWRTTYTRQHPPTAYPTKKDAGFAIELSDNAGTPDLVATMTSGATLRAYVSRGLIVSTRSPAEHKLLRGAIGRAITCESAERGDILAAVVPRSKRFRELATRWRQTECALRARLLILTVDRAGHVDGLARDG